MAIYSTVGVKVTQSLDRETTNWVDIKMTMSSLYRGQSISRSSSKNLTKERLNRRKKYL